ncbi:hypothetical protein EHEL_031400 [Encephalitozoon hellem ATCC 50504]|uniref:Uncharacterized protein n=1 Tax=Encephalitozoon hellem TaxID=27973 RepID=A0A9Q9C3I8_ENCHE|nr:uncharacterized protein EHEL_031400 [Encephalitozoon hellem ATCC 50504]AFM98035.1 hypothetical protein EHEL_031400 [Encephalitozoon hellem ATCC 50504]UTX42840.1 hypothetical protein GPU96_03g05640 [Encephalitozoon hellem]|eukprot:XP_003887016.1 hypothetical protein EHEL_031400 [Encephalitozoon hellem ATCC 50504]
MYVRIGGMDKMVSKHDLRRIFTFTSRIYKSIECSSGIQLYFYSTLHEIMMAQRLNKEKLIGCLEVSFIELTLEEEACLSIVPSKSSHCLYAVCDGDICIDTVEKFFGSPIRCYLRSEKSEETYVVEFKEPVEIRKPDFMKYVFSFEDYIDYVVNARLYDCK